MILTEKIASHIYDILVEHCGAPTSARDNWLYHQTRKPHCSEWRFGGTLGMYGKCWRNGGKWYVDCDVDDYNPTRNKTIEIVNKHLVHLRQRYEIPYGED